MKKTNQEIAVEVIAGKWGNDLQRVKSLTEAGYDAKSVQSIVNAILFDNSPYNPATGKNIVETKDGIKEVEIDIRDCDGLKITLVV